MKVILIEDVDRLGKIGDVVTVKEGYARNYLLPNKKAREANSSNIKLLDALKKKKAAQDKKVMDEAQALADKLAGLTLSITAESGEEDKLFGSVSNDMISESLAVQGIAIDKREIALEEPIKKLGLYTVTVKIHPEVKASLKVLVVKKES